MLKVIEITKEHFRYRAKYLIHTCADWAGYPRYQHKRLAGDLLVLTYHSFCVRKLTGIFSSLPVVMFDQQLRFLKRHFELVTLDQGISRIQSGDPATRPLLAVTIDDGFRDNYELAWPLLKQYKVPATVFLATDFIDNGIPPWPTRIMEIVERTQRRKVFFPFDMDINSRISKAVFVRCTKDAWKGHTHEERRQLIEELRRHLNVPAADTNYPPLTWKQVREMAGSVITFGSHTVYHSILPAVGEDTIERELRDSKQRLEEELESPCPYFAYPDGKHSRLTERLVKSAGFSVAMTQDRGVNSGDDNLLQLKRIEIPSHDPLPTFRGRSCCAW